MKTNEEVRSLAFIVLLLCCWPDMATACSFVDDNTARLNSLVMANWYWLISGGVMVAIIWFELRQKRRILMLPGLILVVFHPRWTVPPSFGMDCSFQNIQAAQLVLALLLIFCTVSIYRYRTSRT